MKAALQLLFPFHAPASYAITRQCSPPSSGLRTEPWSLFVGFNKRRRNL